MPLLNPGDEAPNFDLTSTEDVLLMLADEVVRTAIVLYVCGEVASERVRGDLRALAARRDRLAEASARILVVSPAPLAELKAVQRELALPFPLLHDDRAFSARYGVAGAEGEPALFLVDRRQRLAWAAQPAAAVAEALPELEKFVAALPSPTASLPRSVVNRLIDRIVN